MKRGKQCVQFYKLILSKVKIISLARIRDVIIAVIDISL